MIRKSGNLLKWVFEIPVAAGETVIPVISVSNTYYTNYQNGQNSLERAFYTRQLTLDTTAATLAVDDYTLQALEVDNQASSFTVSGAALKSSGSPADASGYKINLALTMGSDSFDKAFIGGAEDAATADAANAKTILKPTARTFALTGLGSMDAPTVVSFHSAGENIWYERQLALDKTNGKLTITNVGSSGGSGGNGNGSGNSGGSPDTSLYPEGTYKDVSFSIERAAGGTWHNVAWPTCTVYVEDGALYIDFTMERADKSKAPEYAWAETSSGRVTSVIDNETLTCSFNHLPVPSLGRVEVSMMTTAMSSDYVVDYVMYIDDSAILSGGSGSSGSSGSGSSGTGSGGKTDEPSNIVKNEDGSTTETTANDDGSTTAVTSYDDGRTIVTNTAADGSVSEVKKASDGTITEASASISASALAAAEKAGEPVTLSLELPAAEDSAAAAPLTVVLPEGTDSAVVEIPVTGVSESSIVILVNADGTEEILPRTALTENGLMVTLEAGATVKIVDNKQTFEDMPTDAEEAKAIEFVAARGLMNGVGDGAFAPDLPMTRGMFTTVLYRMERKPDAPEGTNYADVEAGLWYSDAIAWATENGIVEGYGESFGVDDKITTEQIAVMLWRLSGKPEAEPVASGAHDWAAEAMSWAIGIGLIGEESTGANASAPASRGWVAKLMERFINLG